MADRSLVFHPDPVLRKKAADVQAVDEEIAGLIDDMVAVMREHNGVGLAANQVGELHRITVIDASGGDDESELRVLINPEILHVEGKQQGEEGCLSFPDIFEFVTRPARVRVRYRNRDFEVVEEEVEGLLARAVCHEIDHLDGVVFLQRMSPIKRRMALKRIEKLQRIGEWPEPATA